MAVPPVTVPVNSPSASPLQSILLVCVIAAVKASGSLIVTEISKVQRRASFTLTVYVPAVNPVNTPEFTKFPASLFAL